MEGPSVLVMIYITTWIFVIAQIIDCVNRFQHCCVAINIIKKKLTRTVNEGWQETHRGGADSFRVQSVSSPYDGTANGNSVSLIVLARVW